MTHHGLTVAVVDDDDSVRLALQELLRAAGFDARSFSSAEDFLATREASDVAFLIADINLPGQSGAALARALTAEGRRIPTVLISARDDATTLTLVRAAGPIPFLRKPFSEDELAEAMALAMRIE
jgi:FixJ family two-component response regulator